MTVVHHDPGLNLRLDSRGGDPDSESAQLRSAHKLLWSKPLPNGSMFTLRDDASPYEYLVHESDLGRFSLASDTCVPGWTNWKRDRIAQITRRVPRAELDLYDTLTYQMGAMLLFPRNGPDESRGTSLNQDRGTNGYIVDRLDLTLECIRLHYEEKEQPDLAEANPLRESLSRWSDFFDLFEDFHGYVDFFLLDDLLTADKEHVSFFLPFEGFEWWPFPKDVEEYAQYRHSALTFVEARNQAMEAWVRGPAS